MNARRTVSLGSLLPDWLADLQLTPPTAKELRALLPTAVVTTMLGLLMLLLGAVVAGLRADDLNVFVAVFAVAYSVGLVALAATAVGHEYVHRTVGFLLIQPAPRQELLRTKLRALLPLLGAAALPGLGAVLLLRDGSLLALWLAVLLSSTLVAPWVTLLCRSTLAGVVFTFALPCVLWMSLNLVAEFVWSANPAECLAWFAGLVIGHWVIGGLLGWRKFMRLEAADGSGTALRLPWMRSRQSTAATFDSAEPAAPVSPIRKVLARKMHVVRPATWMLAKKELRLHPAAWWVAGVFALLWFGQAWLIWRQGRAGEEFLGLTTGFYMLFLPLLVGSLACAEERQFGTHAWHLTLPLGTIRQWAIKSAVAVGLGLLLGLALPWVLASLMPFPTLAFDEFGPAASWAGAIVAMTIVGLYASSASQQSVMALLFGLTLAVVIPPVLIGITALSYSGLLMMLTGHADLVRATDWAGPDAAMYYGVPAVTLVLAWLGCRNFRRPVVTQAEQVGQVMGIAVAVLLAGILAGGAVAVPTYRTYLQAQTAAQARAEDTQLQRPPQEPRSGTMDAEFVRRYGLHWTPSATNTTPHPRAGMMVRYGLIPADAGSANASEPAQSASQSSAATNAPAAK